MVHTSSTGSPAGRAHSPDDFTSLSRSRIPRHGKGEAITQLAQLLFWLTGDTWELELTQDPITPEDSAAQTSEGLEAIALLSGGLDSYLGALHLLSTLRRAAAIRRPLRHRHRRPSCPEHRPQMAPGGLLPRGYDSLIQDRCDGLIQDHLLSDRCVVTV
ncbi:hypothetical protein IWGMT90018_28280 [Mycobacterium kiyosense]|nr:hypothetical protein IWGMT90018_28280 [Mycobacterium kiyosense]